MQCYVYKSNRQNDMYLYITEKDQFELIPAALLEKFGTPIFILDFDLSNRKTLGREDPVQVKHNLEKQGYHLQMPERIETMVIPNKIKH